MFALLTCQTIKKEINKTVIKSKRAIKVHVIKSEQMPIKKNETSLQTNKYQMQSATTWITPNYDLRGLKNLVENSSILPQCIRAYKNNIAGFGIGLKYMEDVEETPEMAEEYDRAKKIIDLLNIEQDTKEVFEDIIEARETFGIAYLEVIRKMMNDEVVQIEFVKETTSISKTVPLPPYITTSYYYRGEEIERKKEYCKYKQEIGGKVVYFKEFGDPRIMDMRNGKYIDVEKGESLSPEFRANEILEFTIGTAPYGTVRWIGQVLGIDGSRRAESLNNNYFINGRHTPLMIIIKNGTLTDESFAKLQRYMNDIKGEAGQHAFIVLEADEIEGRTDFEQQPKSDIEIKDLANILQKDELFQDYLDNNRRKVQSAFQLPDLYVGYTTDFNRATAQTAQEVTEEQVFQPERKSLAWIINNRLLNGYKFKYVEAYFLAPKISNPDDLYKLLSVTNNAGGVTPNFAKRIIYEAYGEQSEDYSEDWGNVPLAYSKTQGGEAYGLGSLTMGLQRQIEKAAGKHDDAVVAVMKEVKRLLKNFEKKLTYDPKRDIIKENWDEDAHPRDENGRFAEGGGSSGDIEIDGPAGTQAYIDTYMSAHPEVLSQTAQYKGVLAKVKNFTADEDGTYDAFTGEKKEITKGYCVTFHQNKSETDTFGGYTDEQYAAMCAIAVHELGADGVNIGYFGNPEVSFNCPDKATALKFAISHNQYSIYDAAKDELNKNPYYNMKTNPIKGHKG